ncbi:MAG: hypothetical protein C5B55_04935 [Blastocatellia bacterium]|nr:MAG: hypothetical protein C5B55_04935 [Blastocatellia bacterium]
MSASLKSLVNPTSRRRLRSFQQRLLSLKESLIWGGKNREKALLWLTGRYYRSRYRREWELDPEEPHFFSQRIGFFEFGFGQERIGPYGFFRGFFGSEMLLPGDELLDIGCGDGFFTRRFFSERCTHVDAVDIEPSAIAAAQEYNSAANITYHLLDAVNEPFPKDQYDVVVWDGALGHFEQQTTSNVLKKIQSVLTPEGVFIGSESLGVEGSDHLQFFESLDDLNALFSPFFRHVELRSVTYKTGIGRGAFVRREAYWRCSNDAARLETCRWRDYGDRNSEPRGGSEAPRSKDQSAG